METYKGAVVREFDLEYVLEVLKIRKSLEMLAVEDAVLNVTDRDLEELEEIARCQRDMLNHYDEYDYIEMDRKFHQKIYELSHNRTLQSLLNNFNDIISFFGIRALKQKERKITTMEEHQKILDAVKSRDAGAAVHAMEEHMSKTFINIEGYMKERRNQ
nr:GntR family transcriptional regulator [[Clostridium] symbiosum]